MSKTVPLALALAILGGRTTAAQPTNAKVAAGVPAPSGTDKLNAHVRVPAKLHIHAVAIVSPACGKAVSFQVQVQNSGGAFAGSTNINNRPGAVLTITDLATKKIVMGPLPSIGAGATVTVPSSGPTFTAACPGSACWEVALLVLEPDSTTPSLPEWDGVKAQVCLKSTCTFELSNPAAH